MESLTITVDNVPPSLNHIINISKGHWAAYSNLKKKWKKKVRDNIHPNVKVRKEPVVITVTFYFGNRHRHDYDNYTPKLILDGLTGKVIGDDSSEYIKELRTRFDYDKENPRTEIKIRT